MRIRVIVSGLVLGTSMLAGALPAAAQDTMNAPLQLSDDTQVVVVEESTEKADCKLEVNGVPQACPPGSVVWVDQTTYGEAKKNNKPHVVLTGDDKKDKAAVDELALKLRKEAKEAKAESEGSFVALGCVATSNTLINGSYTFSTGRRVTYQLEYDFNADCSVTGIRDRTHNDGNPSSWTRSCTNATSSVYPGCTNHGIVLSTSWSIWKNEVNSWAGYEYRHQSSHDFHSAYGWWTLT